MLSSRAKRGYLISLGVAWLSVGGAVVGFFLPWASIDVKEPQQLVKGLTSGTPVDDLTGNLTDQLGRVIVKVKRGAETVTGQLPDLSQIPTRVSGFDVPQLANRQDAQVVIAFAEMLTGERQIGAKSYAVYLLPGVALLCGFVLTLANRVRLLCWFVGVLCLSVAGIGGWKLATTETDTLLVAIAIERGLWLLLWAYVGLGLAALGLAVFQRRGSHEAQTSGTA